MSKNADVARSTCPSQNFTKCIIFRPLLGDPMSRYLDWSIGAKSIYLDKLDS